MSKAKSKIVDLEMNSDGTYTPKGSTIPVKSNKKSKYNYKNEKQPKYTVNRETDEFLGGIDVGLDLLDAVIPRMERFLRLRG